ncbi:ferredoxin reductase family protein [Streptacidiphilus fuscans]|uniref:Ferredoxin reductase family protein n=1 Tax=Streptacidiphilus fuscans TaxID=2789292 RepID=A0A931FHY9_9ACTN|nr:ferredoxin reductase family protein [Streptacidiphilus fuscans]MBF9071209.1 ferredoxin reductase family protein [Streptacidiphilus fuscans]
MATATQQRGTHSRRAHASRPSGGALPVDTVARAALAAIVFGALVVIGIWWKNTLGIVGTDQWLTNAGRITGLLAGYTAPVLLLLMARIPLLEHEIGSDRLARWHAMGGRYMVGLVTAHVLSVIWGYALTDHTNVVGEGVTMVLTFPDMIKASIGTVLIFATGIFSARAARRKLSYDTWYYLHLATYLAIALGFEHQLTNGADLGSGIGRLFWYALYVGTAGVLGWFRLLRPALQDRRHQLRVAEVRPEGPGTVSLFLTGRHLDELGAEAGQFFRLQFLAPGLRFAANPYSLSAPPTAQYLRFTVKDLGGHSAAVAHLKSGTKVRAEGPYGAFTERRRRSRQVLLLAAGVGITPLRALFETLPARPGELTLLYRASREEDVLFHRELVAIAQSRGARLQFLVGPRSEVGDPLEPATLNRLVPGLARHDVFLCGPDPMMESAVAALTAAGVPRRRIHHESFSF